MIIRAISIAALILLNHSSADADMVAREFSRHSESSRVNLVGPAPADLVSVGGTCGGMLQCPTSPANFLALVQSLWAVGRRCGQLSHFPQSLASRRPQRHQRSKTPPQVRSRPDAGRTEPAEELPFGAAKDIQTGGVALGGDDRLPAFLPS
jgi:hypothetical protein